MNFSKYYSLVSEMILRHNNSEGVQVIAWKDGIWRISNEEDEEIYEKISKDLGFPETFDNFYDIVEYIENSRPDVFVGTITGKEELSPYFKSSFTYGPDSPLIRKVMKMLGLTLYVDSSSDEESTDVTYVDKEIPRHPQFAYHGTTVSAALKIIKFGLRPDNDIENWKFKFDDRVFLTTRKIDAIFHANNAANKQKSLPILFRFKIPDPSLIASDYDVAVAFGELDKEPSYKKIREIYPNANYEVEAGKNVKKMSPKTDFTRATGTFSYKGRIPASFINDMGYRNGEFDIMETESYLTTENMINIYDLNEMREVLEKLEEFNFYDPTMDEQDWED
jgi:hypothetical protein